ncbi:MAG: sulfite exporter TauE/SafE family protein [Pyrobaculum sp.]
MADLFLLSLVGLAAGVLGGLLGIGGGVVMLPLLVFWLNLPMAVAVGTSIVAVVLTAVSGSAGHMWRHNVERDVALRSGAGGVVGSVAGSLAFPHLAGMAGALEVGLGFLLLYTALRMVYEGVRGVGSPRRRVGRWGSLAVGLAAGAAAGVFGVGGGFLLVPAYIYLLGLSMRLSVGTSMVAFLPMALVSAAFKVGQGFVDVVDALTLGVGSLAGAQLGAWAASRAPARLLKTAFGLLFTYVALRFIGVVA